MTNNIANKLFFSPANTKLKKLYSILKPAGKIYSFDLPAGRTCPGAKDCKSYVLNGKIKDSKNCQFRCFAASLETSFPLVYKKHQQNYNLVKNKTQKQLVNLILSNLPKDASIIRLHSSGDFFSKVYFNAWLKVAQLRTDITFYCYTKSLKYLIGIPSINLSEGRLLDNFFITASLGGKYDSLVSKLQIRTANVVFDSKFTPFPIDNTDEHAVRPGSSFSLLLHGIQPANTLANKFLQKIKKEAKHGTTI